MNRKGLLLIGIIIVVTLLGSIMIINKKFNDEETDGIYNEIIDDDASLTEDDSFKDDNKNLIFSIRSSRVNCYTNELRVYDDNTYTFGKSNGNYDYDVYKILNNIDNYSPNEHGPFILKDSNDKKYYLYDNNVELNEFIKTIDVFLDTCAIVD